MRKRTKNFILGLLMGSIIMGVLTIGTYLYFGQYKLNQVVSNYELLLEENKMPPLVSVYKLKSDLKKYDVVKSGDYDIVQIPAQLKSDAILEQGVSIEGMSVNSDLVNGTILHSNMVFSPSSLPKDLRVFEIANLITQTVLEKGDSVDIRISFPSGLDYIVLSKKMLKDKMLIKNESATKELCIFHLNEDEILRLSSAMVDAYLHKGTYLYTTLYVSSESQETAKVTYPANLDVQALIKQDPNIVEKAVVALEEQKRQQLSDSLTRLPGNTVRTVPEIKVPVNEDNEQLEKEKEEDISSSEVR